MNMRVEITKENVEQIIIVDYDYCDGYNYGYDGIVRIGLIDSKYLNKVADDLRRADGCKVLFNPIKNENGEYEDYDNQGWYCFYLNIEKDENEYKTNEIQCQLECTEDDEGPDEYYIEVSPMESKVICDYINADGYLDGLFEMESEENEDESYVS